MHIEMTAEDKQIWTRQEDIYGRLMFQAADRADASIMSRTTAIHESMRAPAELSDCDAGLPEFNHNLIR